MNILLSGDMSGSFELAAFGTFPVRMCVCVCVASPNSVVEVALLSSQICRISVHSLNAPEIHDTHFAYSSLIPATSSVTCIFEANTGDELHVGSLHVPQFQENAVALCHIGQSAHRFGAACDLLETCISDCERHCSEISASLTEKLDAMRNVLRQHNSHSSAAEEDLLSLAATGIVRCAIAVHACM